MSLDGRTEAVFADFGLPVAMRFGTQISCRMRKGELTCIP